MSDAVAIRQPAQVDSWVDVVGPVADLAQMIARTDFVPKAFRGNPAATAAAILTGRELGLGPLTSLRGLDVIDGNVQMKAKMVLARILAAGHRVEWLEKSDKACEVKIERADGLTSATVRWTIADAQRAGLAVKQVWQRYPRAMLRSRAVSECAELVCPDVMLGLDMSDAMDDAPVARPSVPTVVQIAQPEPPAVAVAHVAPEPEPVPTQAAEPPQMDAQAPDDGEPLCSQAQMRKIGAQIGELERLDGRKLDRDERRALIAVMAGVDPDSLTSAKDLTKAQASAAIEALDRAVTDGMAEPVDAEIVDDTPDIG